MSDRPAKPANAPRLSPYLAVVDAEKTMKFYEEAFGFEQELMMRDEDGVPMHAEARFKEAVIMFSPACHTQKGWVAPAVSGVDSSVSSFIYVDDVDAFYENAIAHGAKSVQEPKDQFWGDRTCLLKCPDGYQWCFGTNVADFDPSKVPTKAGAES
ncbi:Glyoxalase [Planctomycetales bacterium 10988]|nr:Glyoxalase [Planctomycetales bacterium 10988]